MKDLPPAPPKGRTPDKGGGNLGTANPPAPMVVIAAVPYCLAMVIGFVVVVALAYGHLS